jgi:putative Ca2+/H+ antiporter (TMEM165/GDT1 family)
MDTMLFLSTFFLVFVAELGDKTQLSTLTLAANASSRWIVFFASASALVASSAIAVLVGEGLARLVPPVWIQRAAGVLFLGFGAYTLWHSMRA